MLTCFRFLQGNLLDDTALISVLANTKQTAEEVNERLAGASATNRKLTEACEVRNAAPRLSCPFVHYSASPNCIAAKCICARARAALMLQPVTTAAELLDRSSVP